jgi:hypothetical protein
MVAAANIARPRSSGSSVTRKGPRVSAATAVMIGVPVILLLTFVWQIGSSMLHTEIAVRDAVAVSRVSLEPDVNGSRIDLVLVDRVGQDTTVRGNLNVKLREPDGTVWQTTRAVTAADFVPINGSGLLNGRLGYTVLVPASDWLRAPRRGGSATVSVGVEPTDGTAFSTVAEERFP